MKALEDVTISCLDYSPVMKLIVTGGVEGRIVVIDPSASIVTNQMKGHQSDILDVYFYESHYQIISISSDRVVNIWDANNLDLVQSIKDDM